MRRNLPTGTPRPAGLFLRGIWMLLFAHGLLALAPVTASAGVWINEILFNPPGADTANEYIELRGSPNFVLPQGTWLLGIEGNAGGNPGVVQNRFDLSGFRLGGNGLLVLLQSASPYSPHTNSAVLMNTGGPGWGSGSTSSVGHRGRNGQTELNNASTTFLLLQGTNAPNPGDDIDLDNDGTPDHPRLAEGTVLDSVGILDADGAGDIAFGAINFRRDAPPGSSATASGTIVPVGFTARYVGRFGNTVGHEPGDWVASDDLRGSPPQWLLGAANSTFPVVLTGAPLDHLGAPNFGAPSLPGIVLEPTEGVESLVEGGAPGAYSLRLTSSTTDSVVIQLTCNGRLTVSTDGGVSYHSEAQVALSDTTPHSVLVQAGRDNVLGLSPIRMTVAHRVVAASDPYDLSSVVPDLDLAVRESSTLLFSELKVNPPGTNDAGGEFLELTGQPGTVLSNVVILAVNGNSDADPGVVTYALSVDGLTLGANGLLLVAPTNSPYEVPPETRVLEDPGFNQPGGAIGNGSVSLFLLTTRSLLRVGDDLDAGDNGVLEALPADATVQDSVGWSGGGKDDLVYTSAKLVLGTAAPDAAARFPGCVFPSDAGCWFYGELLPPDPLTLSFEPGMVSFTFPAWTLLTPGKPNNTAPAIRASEPISGVIGDPGNPSLFFEVEDAEAGHGLPTVWATSSNPAVVPSTNLLLTAVEPGKWQLSLTPVGVGYADILLSASDGSMTGHVVIPYAASAPGREGTVWHMGASDGSTAIAVDGGFVLLGDDENQTLRLYHRSVSGLPLQQFDMTPFLGLSDIAAGLPREVDIEASTRVGNRLYWMGSHGHSVEGEPRTNRTRVFATDIVAGSSPPALSYVGRYDYLKLDLLAWDAMNAHGKGSNYYGLVASDADNVPPKAPDGSGLAVEGLSMMPGSVTAAFIGFRAPIVPAHDRTFALVVPVLNFTAVVDNSAPAGSCVFGPPIELDLYGRGIRSIEGSETGFLIVGGPAAGFTGPYPADFRLYTWSGVAGEHARQRSADLGGLNPEGFVGVPPGPWTPATQLAVLSDSGTTVFYGDDIPAKRLPFRNFRKCRADMVQLGKVVKPTPIITSVSSSEGKVRLRWRSLRGEMYALEAGGAGDPVTWSEVGSVPATGPYAEMALDAPDSWALYRVRLLELP